MSNQIFRIGGIPTDNIVAFCGGPITTGAVYIICTKALPRNLINKKILTICAVSAGIFYTAKKLHDRPLELKFADMTKRTIHGVLFTSCSALASSLFCSTVLDNWQG
jgi:hypothetical protein